MSMQSSHLNMALERRIQGWLGKRSAAFALPQTRAGRLYEQIRPRLLPPINVLLWASTVALTLLAAFGAFGARLSLGGTLARLGLAGYSMQLSLIDTYGYLVGLVWLSQGLLLLTQLPTIATGLDNKLLYSTTSGLGLWFAAQTVTGGLAALLMSLDALASPGLFIAGVVMLALSLASTVGGYFSTGVNYGLSGRFRSVSAEHDLAERRAAFERRMAVRKARRVSQQGSLDEFEGSSAYVAPSRRAMLESRSFGERLRTALGIDMLLSDFGFRGKTSMIDDTTSVPLSRDELPMDSAEPTRRSLRAWEYWIVQVPQSLALATLVMATLQATSLWAVSAGSLRPFDMYTGIGLVAIMAGSAQWLLISRRDVFYGAIMAALLLRIATVQATFNVGLFGAAMLASATTAFSTFVAATMQLVELVRYPPRSVTTLLFDDDGRIMDETDLRRSAQETAALPAAAKRRTWPAEPTASASAAADKRTAQSGGVPMSSA